jgi:hypothetical protein
MNPATREKDIHKQVCTYLKLVYPSCVFNTDLSGIRLTLGQAVRLKSLRSFRGFPDIAIFEPRNGSHALFIELKREGERLIKKNGEYASEHIKEQVDCIGMLRERGYSAVMVSGFEQAKKVIDAYLKS